FDSTKEIIEYSREQSDRDFQAIKNRYAKLEAGSYRKELNMTKVQNQIKLINGFSKHLSETTKNMNYLMAKSKEPAISDHITLPLKYQQGFINILKSLCELLNNEELYRQAISFIQNLESSEGNEFGNAIASLLVPSNKNRVQQLANSVAIRTSGAAAAARFRNDTAKAPLTNRVLSSRQGQGDIPKSTQKKYLFDASGSYSLVTICKYVQSHKSTDRYKSIQVHTDRKTGT
ncbi:hypothetical protein BB560_005994, partial [Smittium megazygosporum]